MVGMSTHERDRAVFWRLWWNVRLNSQRSAWPHSQYFEAKGKISLGILGPVVADTIQSTNSIPTGIFLPVFCCRESLR